MMKNLLLLVLVSIGLSCFSQNELVLRLDHWVGAEKFEIDLTYTEPDQGYDFNITRLEYYISDITITHDGNQETFLEDTWVLVDAAGESDYSLGLHNIDEVEEITYSIGVDPDHNHLDPTTFPPGHPLAPQNPSMHWGWASGYRFAALEGKAGMNLIFTYEIHALGDNNYFETSMPTASLNENGKVIIPLHADYLGMYKNIDVSFGMIEHGEIGAAKTLLQNFSDQVFAQIAFTSTPELEEEQSMSVYPNPVVDGFCTVKYDLVPGQNTELIVTDVAGRKILTENMAGQQTSARIELPNNGVYFVQLWQDGQAVKTEKIVVTQ